MQQTDAERLITIFTLCNILVFYFICVGVFWFANKSRLNKALAAQKFTWTLIILGIALPTYSMWYPPANGTWRMVFWLLLDVTSWLVLFEVWRVNRYALPQWFPGSKRLENQPDVNGLP